jgi:para-nitrobenzyl esterase
MIPAGEQTRSGEAGRLSRCAPYGAAHAFDLAFAFGNFGPSLFSNIAYSDANEPGRLLLSQAMMQPRRVREGGRPEQRHARDRLDLAVRLVFDATDTAAAMSVQ